MAFIVNMSNHKKIDSTIDLELEKLIEKRKDWVRSSKENKFVFDSILAGLYNDPSHFIYEILQNAEDAGAKKVRFELFEDRLDIYHDGIDFVFKDIDGVTGIAIPKERDLNAIGIFGVGFKSVFAVTKTPYIFSGKYKIKIEDFVVPSAVNGNDQVNETLIKLPFNHNKRSSKEAFKLISEKLGNIGLKTLLFLKNIKVIQWQTPSSNGYYSKSSKDFPKNKNTKKVTIKSTNFSEEYLIIWKPIRLDGIKPRKGEELRVEVAYKLGKNKKDKKIITPELDSELVVFFPTNKDTDLNFTIQGPYKTTPNRENIPLEDEQNKVIIEETGNLVSGSLSIIKDLGYLDVNFLNILPINKQEHMDEQIYPVIYQKVKEKLLSDELLPTSNGKYTKAENSLLARGKELTEFLDSKDTQKLFNKKNWLDTNITEDKKPDLRDYLIDELGVKIVDFEIFAEKIDIEFIQKKTDKWIINFYSRLLNREDKNHLIDILRNKPIVKLDTNEYIEPFNNEGKIQVYLPTETKSKYKTVKRIFKKDKKSLKFLTELGITERDLFDEIKEEILPKYQIDNSTKDEEYFEDFRKLLRAFETVQSDKKDEFMNELSKASFIDSINNITGKNYLRKPSETYFKDNDLKNYFDGYHFVYFVSDKLYKRFGKEKLDPFLKELGVEDKPRRIEIQGNLSREQIIKLQNGRAGAYGYFGARQISYELECLEPFIKEISNNKSLLLWKLLLKNIKQGDYNFFKGELHWSYYTQYSEVFDAKFLITLRTQAWLVDKNGVFKKPCEITFSELSNNYIKKSPNIDILKDALEFKSEIINQLPKDKQEMLEILGREGITPERLKEILRETKEETSDEVEKTWVPEHEPDTINAKIADWEPNKIVTPDLTGQGDQIDTGEDDELKNDDKKPEEDENKNPINRKAIGNWGEKFVYHVLEKEYQKKGIIKETNSGFKVKSADNELFEIIWLNKQSGKKGIGCDFVIKRNGKKIKYIEVKAKTQEKVELIEVNGAQWEFARSLFDRKEGDKYSFYVVTNTGKPDAKIRSLTNPIKLWKEGKLYAHPVNFKL